MGRGINKGLGKELFNQLVEKGYFVFGLLRDKEVYNELNKNKPKNVELILADISDDNCIEKIQKGVKNSILDLVINNAGIGGEGMKLENVNSNEIIDLLNVHCLGVLRVMKSISKNLIKNNKATAQVIFEKNFHASIVAVMSPIPTTKKAATPFE